MAPTPDLNGKDPIRFSDLSRRIDHEFLLVADRDLLETLRADLNLLALEKVRLQGTLCPVGDKDWDLVGGVGATVTQPCVVSLAPVRTRIDDPVRRSFLFDLQEDDAASEVEMPEDETLENLPERLDFRAVLREALGLALPAYPRAPDAELQQSDYAAPGVQPMTDADAHPFAGLAALRPKAGDDGEPDR